jgi:hydrogenase nickel incorporation protein HypA/HybF
VHEYAIVSDLMDRVRGEAEAHGAARVVRLSVRIGELSGVDPELLRVAWETFRERTICEGAPMALERVQAVWRCPRCETAIARGAVLRCAACNVPARLVQGDEIVLDRVEMEVPDV